MKYGLLAGKLKQTVLLVYGCCEYPSYQGDFAHARTVGAPSDFRAPGNEASDNHSHILWSCLL